MKAIILFALVPFLLSGIASADGAPILTGSTLKTDDIVRKSDVIFVGKVTELGMPNPTSTDMAEFAGTKVKVLHVLRGSVGSQMVVPIPISGRDRESPPNINFKYIFFGHRNTEVEGEPFAVLKLLPGTDDNVALVKKLISN